VTSPAERPGVRVLVAEDSAVMREYLVHLLGGDPGITVVGAARNGVEAVEMAERLRPDVVVMDIHMPRLDGYEATREIMSRAPAPIVMVISSLAPDDVVVTLDALRVGAVTVLEKPGGPDHSDSGRTVPRLLETVKLMAEVKVVRRWRERPAAPWTPPIERPGCRVRLVAMGASTGGPAVVAQILAELPADLGAPVVLAQHIAPGFAPGLAEWLGRATPLHVKLADPGEVVRPGCVYLAPDRLQMGITSEGRVRLAPGRPRTASARPSPTSSVRWPRRSAALPWGSSSPGWDGTERRGSSRSARRRGSPSSRTSRRASCSGCRARPSG
jgi:two-component system chemotaxis response regulator CheB